MFILLVSIHVKPECIETFKAATVANATATLKEAGVRRYDFSQQADDPSRFIIYEGYRSPDDHALHRETPHYLTWRDTVAPMMATPRSALKYGNIHPADGAW